jgi:hypothetical protein
MGQEVINWIIGAFGALLGFLLNQLWTAVKDLQAADKDLTDKVSKVEVLVAGQYVTRDDFKRSIDALFNKLDRIDEKLNGKQDRIQ